MHCGREDTAPNTTEHPTSYSVPVKPYILRQAGEQLKEQVAYYMNNAHYILNGLGSRSKKAGFTVSGGVNAP